MVLQFAGVAYGPVPSGMLLEEELAAIGLSAERLREVVDRLEPVEAEVESGTGTSELWLHDFGSPLLERFGLKMMPGTLNLWASSPIRLPSPIEVRGEGRFRLERGFFSPAVLDEEALGFVFRKKREASERFLEVFAHTHLRTRLRLEDGDRVEVHLLPSDDLPEAL